MVSLIRAAEIGGSHLIAADVSLRHGCGLSGGILYTCCYCDRDDVRSSFAVCGGGVGYNGLFSQKFMGILSASDEHVSLFLIHTRFLVALEFQLKT